MAAKYSLVPGLVRSRTILLAETEQAILSMVRGGVLLTSDFGR